MPPPHHLSGGSAISGTTVGQTTLPGVHPPWGWERPWWAWGPWLPFGHPYPSYYTVPQEPKVPLGPFLAQAVQSFASSIGSIIGLRNAALGRAVRDALSRDIQNTTFVYAGTTYTANTLVSQSSASSVAATIAKTTMFQPDVVGNITANIAKSMNLGPVGQAAANEAADAAAVLHP